MKTSEKNLKAVIGRCMGSTREDTIAAIIGAQDSAEYLIDSRKYGYAAGRDEYVSMHKEQARRQAGIDYDVARGCLYECSSERGTMQAFHQALEILAGRHAAPLVIAWLFQW